MQRNEGGTALVAMSIAVVAAAIALIVFTVLASSRP